MRSVRRPFVALVLLSLLSVGARVALLGEPCRSPCRAASDHILVFDESYYVNAARVIASVAPPAGMPYAVAPLGDDPNAEHPQLAKLMIAGSIELFGDGPLAWRLASVVFGSLAIIGMFALVRAAGGGPWPAVGASALMALDNLLIVHGRIGTLDIYVVSAMIWALTLYLRGRTVAAGVLLGIGACFKLVAFFALAVVMLLELLGAWSSPRRFRPAAGRVGRFAVAASASFLALLAVLDRVAPPYDYTTGKRIGGGPFAHIGHMLSFAAGQSSPHGPRGIASYPWQWLGDWKPITYLYINPSRPSPGLYGIHPAVHFWGMVSPPILALALPALALAGAVAARRRSRARAGVAVLALAWVLGTLLPFELLSVLWSRTSYLYYMVIVMPGMYVAVSLLVARIGARRRTVLVWMAGVLAAAIVMYPFTPLP
jgi:predicted membrane-bound dolichyl-phosphate-mannose-protein mannosyltransferase